MVRQQRIVGIAYTRTVLGQGEIEIIISDS